MPCARLGWPSHQLLSARIVSYRTLSPVRVRSIVTKYCDQRVCMSLFVCLFACLFGCLPVRLPVRSHISKPHVQISPNFSVSITFYRGSVLLWRQCNKLCTFGFVDFIMYSCNGSNRLESKTTFRPFRHMAGGTGSEVCRLRLYLFDKCILASVSVWNQAGPANISLQKRVSRPTSRQVVFNVQHTHVQ